MKRFIISSLFAMLLVACTSPEQQLAVNCLKSHLKCPSTLKVVEFSSRWCEADTTMDTTYHVRSINGSREKLAMYHENELKTIVIDSMRIATRIDPAHKYYSITFDSQNLMGAMVRNTKGVVIYQGHAMMWENWFEHNYFSRDITTIAHRETIRNPKLKKYSKYLSVGEWIEK